MSILVPLLTQAGAPAVPPFAVAQVGTIQVDFLLDGDYRNQDVIGWKVVIEATGTGRFFWSVTGDNPAGGGYFSIGTWVPPVVGSVFYEHEVTAEDVYYDDPGGFAYSLENLLLAIATTSTPDEQYRHGSAFLYCSSGFLQVTRFDIVLLTAETPAITADFDFNVQDNGIVVDFDASASGPDVATYSWDFADPLNPLPTETPDATIAHTYSVPGTYDVTLTVVTDTGQTASVTKSLTIAPEEIAGVAGPTRVRFQRPGRAGR